MKVKHFLVSTISSIFIKIQIDRDIDSAFFFGIPQFKKMKSHEGIAFQIKILYRKKIFRNSIFKVLKRQKMFEKDTFKITFYTIFSRNSHLNVG